MVDWVRRWSVVVVAVVVVGAAPAPAWTAVAAADTGFEGPTFSGASSPTAEKPQSKLWHHFGRWWGVLFDDVNGDYTIHRFNRSTNTWTNTGVLVDNRNASHADALSDGNRLYVASALRPGATSSDSSARLLRYTYDSGAQRYVQDAGFPISLYSGPLEAIVIDKDTAGMLWATFTTPNSSGGRSVRVTHSGSSDTSWVTPYVLPTAGATTLSSDDISAVVAFRSQIGVMWSNQNEDTVYFATHRDGDPDNAWQLSPALQGPRYADDHINLKSLQAGPEGEVLAAVKTELQDGRSPLILLLVLREGTWSRHTFGTVSENHTRPLVVVDDENRQAYVFAASPCCSGGVVYMKQTPLGNISFPSGLGTPFIASATNTTINNPTSTKQPVNSTTGLLVLAGDDRTRRYLHNTIALSSTVETTIDSGPTGVVSSPDATFSFSSSPSTATFECRLDAGPYGMCTSPVSLTTLAEGPHTFEVRAIDSAGHPDPTPASRTWTVDAASPSVVATAPVDGATAVDRAAVAAATFSEPIDATTVTTSTFRLVVDGAADAVPAAVQYDASSKTATLRPSAPLPVGTRFVATVAGGPSGVRDTGGSGLPADVTWAFTTEAADTTPPDTSIGDSSTTGTVSTSTAMFEFSSTEAGSSFECRVDGGVYLQCSSPHTLLGVEDGTHTFEVRAVDSASNVDPTPASRTWTVNALLFADGFETGDFSQWTVRTGADGTAVVQDTLVRNGTYAARLRATANPGSYSYAFRSLGSPRTEVTVSADVHVVDEGSSGKAVSVLTLRDGNGLLVDIQRLNGSGRLLLEHSGTTTALPVSLPLSTWARVLVRVITAGPGASTVEVSVSGTPVYRTTTASLGTAGVNRIEIGSNARRQAFHTVFDNVTARR
jgi:hypothetical protein